MESALKGVIGNTKSNTVDDILEASEYDPNFDNMELQDFSESEKNELLEHVFAFWKKPNGYRQNGSSFKSYRSPNFNSNTKNSYNSKYQYGQSLNPKDFQTGEVIRCFGCGSRLHLY